MQIPLWNIKSRIRKRMKLDERLSCTFLFDDCRRRNDLVSSGFMFIAPLTRLAQNGKTVTGKSVFRRRSSLGAIMENAINYFARTASTRSRS